MRINSWISALFLLSAVGNAFPTTPSIDPGLIPRDDLVVPTEDLILPRALTEPTTKKLITRGRTTKTPVKAPKKAPKKATKAPVKATKSPVKATKAPVKGAKAPVKAPTTKKKTTTTADSCPMPSKGGKKIGRRGQVCSGARPPNTFEVFVFAGGEPAGPNAREHCGIFIALQPDVPSSGLATGTLLHSINTNPGGSFELKPEWKVNHVTDPDRRLRGGAIGTITKARLEEFKTAAWPGLRAPNGVETEGPGSTTVADCQTFTGRVRTALTPYMG